MEANYHHEEKIHHNHNSNNSSSNNNSNSSNSISNNVDDSNNDEADFYELEVGGVGGANIITSTKPFRTQPLNTYQKTAQGWRIPEIHEIDGNNAHTTKAYAVGVLISCTSEGKGYLLFAHQPARVIKVTDQKGELQNAGWKYFIGVQQQSDINMEATAARVVSEEAFELFGGYGDVMKLLHSPHSHFYLFPHCFMIYLGELTLEKMVESEDAFVKKRKFKLRPKNRFIKQIKWLEVSQLFDFCISNQLPVSFQLHPQKSKESGNVNNNSNDNNNNNNNSNGGGGGGGNSRNFQPFVRKHFQTYLSNDWERSCYPLYLLLKGKSPIRAC